MARVESGASRREALEFHPVWGNQACCFYIPGATMGQVLHGSAPTTHAIRTAI